MSRGGFNRNQRLEGEIRAVLSKALIRNTKDPRLEGVVISAVRLNRDRTRARVYFSFFGDAEKLREISDGFGAAASFLRGELGRRMRLRILPELEFHRDDSYEYGDRIERLFEDLHGEKEETS